MARPASPTGGVRIANAFSPNGKTAYVTLVGEDRILVIEDGRIPFPDGHFDLVVSNMVFEHVEDLVAEVSIAVQITPSMVELVDEHDRRSLGRQPARRIHEHGL